MVHYCVIHVPICVEFTDTIFLRELSYPFYGEISCFKKCSQQCRPLATYTLASHVPNTRLMVRTSQSSFLKGDTANLIDLVNGPGYRPGGTASQVLHRGYAMGYAFYSALKNGRNSAMKKSIILYTRSNKLKKIEIFLNFFMPIRVV